jgi:transposase-like protein
MRYPASEKAEIIRIVEQSSLSARKTLAQIGVPRATFYRWYDQYQTGGPEALEDNQSGPSRVWNRIPDDVRAAKRTRCACRDDTIPCPGWRSFPTALAISRKRHNVTSLSCGVKDMQHRSRLPIDLSPVVGPVVETRTERIDHVMTVRSLLPLLANETLLSVVEAGASKLSAPWTV